MDKLNCVTQTQEKCTLCMHAGNFKWDYNYHAWE